MMRIVTVELESLSPYSQSKYHKTPKKEGEDDAGWEARTWPNRMHLDNDDMVVIPPMALKNCIDAAASFLGMKIEGRGRRTWTKLIESGVMVTDPAPLNIHKDDVEGEWLFLNANGKRGPGTRVERCYPRIGAWKTDAVMHVLNAEIKEDVFLKHLETAGMFVGIGRFRPANRGFYGRFKVNDVEWREA